MGYRHAMLSAHTLHTIVNDKDDGCVRQKSGTTGGGTVCCQRRCTRVARPAAVSSLANEELTIRRCQIQQRHSSNVANTLRAVHAWRGKG